MSDGPLKRLWGWLRGDGIPALPAPEPQHRREPAVLRSQHDSWLAKLVAAAVDGERTDDIGGDEFWQHVRALWHEGHEKLAIEWLDKFIASELTPADAVVPLRVGLVDLLEARGDLDAALDHLRALTEISEHATRSHFLLAEHYRRRGDEAAAMRHYEAVLARDVDYPNARVRLERLRQRRGRAAPAGQQATLAGGEILGAQTGARYQLLRELGRGATAVVYLARDRELEREVAVKLLHPHLAEATSREACMHFFREARLAASLRHPNIVAILDVDESARRLVMELAAGGTLRAWLSDSPTLEVRTALARHVQILSALSVAHQRGIVHRDVKPGNLMFRRNPDEAGVEIMLGDFGVAHLPEGTEHTRDETRAQARARGAAIGTLAYMPPEQRRGDEVTGKADVYAAAVILYEMLAGRHPLPSGAILSGERRAGDFRLPDEAQTPWPEPVAAAVQHHLDWLSAPDAAPRPDADSALAAARKLRDLALAAATDRRVIG